MHPGAIKLFRRNDLLELARLAATRVAQLTGQRFGPLNAMFIKILGQQQLKSFPCQSCTFNSNGKLADALQSLKVLLKLIFRLGAAASGVNSFNSLDLCARLEDGFVADRFAHHAGAGLADAASAAFETHLDARFRGRTLSRNQLTVEGDLIPAQRVLALQTKLAAFDLAFATRPA